LREDNVGDVPEGMSECWSALGGSNDSEFTGADLRPIIVIKTFDVTEIERSKTSGGKTLVERKLGLRKVFIEKSRHKTVACMAFALETDSQADITYFQAGLADSIKRKMNVPSLAMILQDVMEKIIVRLEGCSAR
jgi:hypothetical protein